MSNSVLSLYLADEQVTQIRFFSTKYVPEIRDALITLKSFSKEQIDKHGIKELQVSDVQELLDKSIDTARHLGGLESWKEKLSIDLPDMAKNIIEFCKSVIDVIEGLPSIKGLKVADLTEEEIKSFPKMLLTSMELNNVCTIKDHVSALKVSISSSQETVSDFQKAITRFKSSLEIEVEPRLRRLLELFAAAGVGIEIREIDLDIKRINSELKLAIEAHRKASGYIENLSQASVINAKFKKIKELVSKKELLIVAGKNSNSGFHWVFENLNNSAFYLLETIWQNAPLIREFEALWIDTLALIDSSQVKVDNIKDTDGLLFFKLTVKGIKSGWEKIDKNLFG
nr:hypothetical protein [uncultured Pseudomonas sp.]